MIIRSLSIQSHDKLGTPVFKLMIIFVCCIQTQLIVFMPHAGRDADGRRDVGRVGCGTCDLAPRGAKKTVNEKKRRVNYENTRIG